MQRIDRCPACDGPVHDARCVHRRERDGLFRCPQCRSLYSNPRYTPDELNALYREEYYDESVRSDQPRWAEQEDAEVLHRTFLRVLRQIYPSLRPSNCGVLDYGCGLGYFLAEAGRAGFLPRGIELSSVAAQHARDALGLNVQTADESPLEAEPKAAFDLVTSFAVIEHVIEPRRVLTLLIEKLKPGGVLAISLPNLGCWRYRIEKGQWFNIVNPTHLTFFSLSAICNLLSNLGMVRVRRTVYWGGRPGFGPIRNAMQYGVRLLNLGSEFRICAEKPHAR